MKSNALFNNMNRLIQYFTANGLKNHIERKSEILGSIIYESSSVLAFNLYFLLTNHKKYGKRSF